MKFYFSIHLLVSHLLSWLPSATFRVQSDSFSGMTTHGSFVYECTYFDDHEGRNKDCKVYVHYNNFYVLVADY